MAFDTGKYVEWRDSPTAPSESGGITTTTTTTAGTSAIPVYWETTVPSNSVSDTVAQIIKLTMLSGIKEGKDDIELAKDYAMYFKLLRDNLKKEIKNGY